MAKPKELTIRAIWLGKALEAIREEAGIYAKDAASYLGKDPSSISRMEDGKIPVNEETLEGYLEMCGIVDPHRCADLRTIRRDAAHAGWWDGYQGDIVSTLMDHNWVESKAEFIQAFELSYIPGLLQTPKYAEAVMRIVDPDVSEDDISRWMEVRMTRQHIITKHNPAHFHCLIDEHILRREVGDSDVMATQLDYLLEASTKKNIDVHILQASKHWGASGSFKVMQLIAPYPTIGYVASPAGDICVEGDSVHRLAQTYDRLVEASLDSAASRKHIEATKEKS